MKAELLMDGQLKEAEITRIYGGGINTYSLIVDGRKYKFQHESNYYRDTHFRHTWTNGYLIPVKGAIIDAQIKLFKEI